jgi:hypothetical protein
MPESVDMMIAPKFEKFRQEPQDPGGKVRPREARQPDASVVVPDAGQSKDRLRPRPILNGTVSWRQDVGLNKGK